MIYVAARSFSKTAALRQQLLNVTGGVHVQFEEPTTPLNDPEVFSRAYEASILVLGRDRFGRREIERLPNLKHLVKYGVGLDNVDVKALEDRSVELHWRGGVNARHVAELTLGLTLGLVRNISHSSHLIRRGFWKKDGGEDLFGAKVTIVGCGYVGERVAFLFKAFGCEVFVVDLVDKSALCRENGYRQVSFEEGLRVCNIVSLHVPLTSQTNKMIAQRELGWLGEDGYLINTARGEVVDHTDLKTALNAGAIRGAGLDVFETEPICDFDLTSHPRVVCTPHIGGGSTGARQSMGGSVVGYVEEILK